MFNSFDEAQPADTLHPLSCCKTHVYDLQLSDWFRFELTQVYLSFKVEPQFMHQVESTVNLQLLSLHTSLFTSFSLSFYLPLALSILVFCRLAKADKVNFK